MATWTCKWCGRTYDVQHCADGSNAYCSNKCYEAAKSAKGSSSGGVKLGPNGTDAASLGRVLKLVGMVFVALFAVITVLCYTFPKFLKSKSKKLLYAYIIVWAVLLVSAAVYLFVLRPNMDGIRNTFSDTKVETVSTSCETEEQFVSIVKNALSGVSAAKLEGEEFSTYSGQAVDAVKERHATPENSVYFVRFPDNVNVYLWFEGTTPSQAYVYRLSSQQ